MFTRRHLWVMLAFAALLLMGGTALIARSAQQNITLQVPPETKPQGGDILTKSASLSTLVANGLVGTPPNAATQAAGAKPFPTCVAQPGTLPTAVISPSTYPNDPLPDLQRTVVASWIASGLGYAAPSKTIDLVPQLDPSVKWEITVGHADCGTVRYLVSNDTVNSFTSTLPPGSVVVNILPPPSTSPRYPVGPTSSAPPKVYPPTPTAAGSAATPGTAKVTAG